jgi:formylglycine-generating enzyme required for sulfatase activity
MKIAREPLAPPSQEPSGQTSQPVPVRFAAWPTRVRDFDAFVAETNYDATADMLSLGRDGWAARGATWRRPGFPQGPDHPVVGVSYEDALQFCRWLTRRERERELIAPDECYRLPTDEEWQRLADFVRPWPGSMYAWGNYWPPMPFDGNFAGEEVLDSPNWPEGWDCIRDTRDSYVGTSPVTWEGGNYRGYRDITGNVWQWTSTPFHKELNPPELRARYPFLDSDTDVTGKPSKVIRGGCWNDYFPGLLELNTRGAREPHNRNAGLGFRVVVAPGEVPND